MDELRTERLVLRPLMPEDLEHYVALYADPDVVRYIGDGSVATRGESAEWLERTLRRNAVEGWDMRTVRLLDGTFVGRCGIAVQDLEHGVEREVGYMLAREHWGNGYATEAASAVRDHTLRRYRRLIALIAHGNEASVAVARKIGMTFEREVLFHERPTRMFALATSEV
ncbi:MAG TPA: GNAT family N-acetyltransferase [Actinomycetota bacterium]|nr:GNAT family N-acetyltransferase [Actinomycetota bacterium]